MDANHEKSPNNHRVATITGEWQWQRNSRVKPSFLAVPSSYGCVKYREAKMHFSLLLIFSGCEKAAWWRQLTEGSICWGCHLRGLECKPFTAGSIASTGQTWELRSHLPSTKHAWWGWGSSNWEWCGLLKHQSPPPSDTTPPPNPFQVVPLTEDQVFKCMNIWGPFSLKYEGGAIWQVGSM